MLNGDLATDCQTFVEWHEDQLGRTLPTWQSRMEAIAAGDIDPKSGDAETLLLGCANVAAKTVSAFASDCGESLLCGDKEAVDRIARKMMTALQSGDKECLTVWGGIADCHLAEMV